MTQNCTFLLAIQSLNGIRIDKVHDPSKVAQFKNAKEDLMKSSFAQYDLLKIKIDGAFVGPSINQKGSEPASYQVLVVQYHRITGASFGSIRDLARVQ